MEGEDRVFDATSGERLPLEIIAIDRLTTSSLYRFQFQQLQDGTAVLVLNDPSLEPLGNEEEQQPGAGTTATSE